MKRIYWNLRVIRVLGSTKTPHLPLQSALPVNFCFTLQIFFGTTNISNYFQNLFHPLFFLPRYLAGWSSATAPLDSDNAFLGGGKLKQFTSLHYKIHRGKVKQNQGQNCKDPFVQCTQPGMNISHCFHVVSRSVTPPPN